MNEFYEEHPTNLSSTIDFRPVELEIRYEDGIVREYMGLCISIDGEEMILHWANTKMLVFGIEKGEHSIYNHIDDY